MLSSRNYSRTTADSPIGSPPMAMSSTRDGRRESRSSRRSCLTREPESRWRRWGLRDVLPGDPIDDLGNARFDYTKPGRNAGVPLPVVRPKSNVADLIFSEFGPGIQRPPRDYSSKHGAMGRALSLPVPLHLVANIAVVVIHSEVRRIATRGVVALVADKQPGRYRTIGENPRDTMSAVLSSAHADNSVAVTAVPGTSPYPARAEFWTVLRHGAVSVDPFPKIRHGILPHSSVEPPHRGSGIRGRSLLVAAVGLARHFITGDVSHG